MPSDAVLYPTALVVFGGFGLLAPTRALAVYRVTRGLSPDSESDSATKVRIVSALLVLVGVLGLARQLA